MIYIRITRKPGSVLKLSDHLQPKDTLTYIKKSTWKTNESGDLWRHDSAAGSITWTLLSDSKLECVLDGGDTDDDWELWRALSGYLFRYELRDHIERIEFGKTLQS